MDDAIRDGLLDGIARGLRKLDAGGVGQSERKLWAVEVALLDSDGEPVRVCGLSFVLGWVVQRQRTDEDARDITAAVEAHVQYHDGPCVECDESHRDPCAECGRAPGDGAGDGCDLCDALQRESGGENEPASPSDDDIELSDGGVIERPDSDGTIRRRDVNGNCEEVRRPGDDDYSEWRVLFVSDEDKVRAVVRKLGRDRVVALLADASIECRDEESDDTLREALVVNVLDGTIDESSLHDENS